MRVEQLKTKLRNLRDFLDQESPAEHVVAWISECVAFFSSLGMSDSTVSGFMRTFENEKIESSSLLSMPRGNIGPFKRSGAGDSLRLATGFSMFSGNRHAEQLYIDIAFRTAENIIDNIEDSERLISKSLAGFFSGKTEFSNISSSLEQMQENFEKKDSSSMAFNAIALLENILELEPSLRGLELSKKIGRIIADSNLQEKFGVRKEVLCALDNFRILRNHLVTHKSIPIEYNVPFAVSLGASYLVVLFLQTTMAAGVLVK